MEHAARQIAIHKEWLEQKGYDEKSLESYKRPGAFMKTFQAMFTACLLHALKLEAKQNFEIPITGFFKNNRDLVFFKFQYEYDPKLHELNLVNLKTFFNGITKDYPISNNQREDLPHSKDVHLQLLAEKFNIRADILAPKAETKPRNRL